MFSSYNRWRHQKPFGFLRFLGRIKREHCSEMGWQFKLQSCFCRVFFGLRIWYKCLTSSLLIWLSWKRKRELNLALIKLIPRKHSSWWRHLEDVLETSDVFVFRRRLVQHEYIHLSHTSSEGVFKASWSRRIYSPWWYVFKTSSRRLAKTSWRHLQDFFKTSSRRFRKMSPRRLQDVSKTYHQVKLLLLARLEDIFETYSARFRDVLRRRLSTGRFA